MGNIRLTIKKLLGYKFLPAVLAFAAVIIMLPSLRVGLFGDDFIQRVILVKPSQLPDRLYETGHVPDNPGRLSTAVFNQFGFNRNRQNMNKYRDYGLVPWWTHESIKASLWRPLTALTHWVDYRLFPDRPALMHAHNVMWFAAVVFLAAIVYRRLLPAPWLGGLAGVFFLLDKNSYFPVTFIANRGFFIAMFFAMLALLAHHRWRSKNSLLAAIIAQIFLVLSLLSNEAGVTTFAYILAYAFTLDRAGWKRRVLSLVPAVSVIVIWRVVYDLLGYGVYGVDLYIDPRHEPLSYLLALFQRAPIILMSQLTGQPSELFLSLNNSARMWLWSLSLGFVIIIFSVLIVLVRRSSAMRFWFLAMIFTVIPISTVAPLSKNLPFVAISAFGLIALFIDAVFTKQDWVPKSSLWRVPAWIICIIFLIVHIPTAMAARAASPKMTKFLFSASGPAINLSSSVDLEDQSLIVVNEPSPLTFTIMPFLQAYNNEPLPKAIRVLALGLSDMEMLRTDDKTVVLKTKSGNIFSCDQSSTLHFIHLLKNFDFFRAERFSFNIGGKVVLPNVTVEIINIDKKGQPTEVSFRFAVPLEHQSLHWIRFNWTNGSYSSFEVPPLGQKVEIPGPPSVSLKDSINFITNLLCKK